MMGLSVWGFYAASSHPPSLSPLEMWRRKKKKLFRVYMYGCFDMMHYGHCNVFRQARAIATNRSSALPEMPRLLLTRVLPLLLSMKDGYDAYALSKSCHGHGLKFEDGASAGATCIAHFLPTSCRIVQFSNNKILRVAQGLIEFLLVGIHTDQSVSAKTGAHHPIMNLHERSLVFWLAIMLMN
ncbi:hypothetical protein Nepgr_011915 [Nepenthes gracilis]|uniref:Cytidyltransferase-like domain-containing protein n=1 Tax=Nepenthes gracilis TaxID=150966 RepID=A0AAD3SG08_NEPGR|nr:hypothetical protein Nepgr_011915 [Nepenthes gracilis]